MFGFPFGNGFRDEFLISVFEEYLSSLGLPSSSFDLLRLSDCIRGDPTPSLSFSLVRVFALRVRRKNGLSSRLWVELVLEVIMRFRALRL